jgi:DNA processing protein
VFDALSSDPIHIDTLTEKIAMSSADALVNLLSLEFKGLVRQMPGKLFVRQS